LCLHLEPNVGEGEYINTQTWVVELAVSALLYTKLDRIFKRARLGALDFGKTKIFWGFGSKNTKKKENNDRMGSCQGVTWGWTKNDL